MAARGKSKGKGKGKGTGEKEKARSPVQRGKDKLRARLTATFRKQLKEKLAARDALWRGRLEAAKASAGEKRAAAAQRHRAAKERKTARFWARKEANGCAGVSHGKHFWC